jgi:hypothetical protein
VAEGGVGIWAEDLWHLDLWHPNVWGTTGSALLLVPFVFLAMPTRRVVFGMPAFGGAAVAETLTKNPQEVVDVSFSMADNVPAGATVQTGKVYASRKATVSPSIPDQTTTVSSASVADASTIVLGANPGVGAYLLLHPQGAREELVLVTAVSGSGPTFTATVDPLLANAHNSGESVSYEPGASALVLASTTATVSQNVLTFRVQRGVSGRVYRLFLLGVLDTGAILRGELLLAVTED